MTLAKAKTKLISLLKKAEAYKKKAAVFTGTTNDTPTLHKLAYPLVEARTLQREAAAVGCSPQKPD